MYLWEYFVTFAKRHRPGSVWRFLAHERRDKGYGAEIELKSVDQSYPTEFDECVVDAWLHIEQLDARLWTMRIGPLRVEVTVGERGQARVVQVADEDRGDAYVSEQKRTGEMVWSKR